MSPLIEAVGWALLHSLWQGALLAALVALALRQVDRRAAALRYGLTCTALALLPLLVVGTAWHAYTPPAPAPACCEPVLPLSPSEAAPTLAAAEPVAVAGPEAPGLAAQLQAQVAAALPWLVLAWALGVALSSLRLLRSHARLRRLVRGGRSPRRRRGRRGSRSSPGAWGCRDRWRCWRRAGWTARPPWAGWCRWCCSR